jgi:gluconolactonase
VVAAGLRLLADGLDHPECVAWAPREGVVYAGGEAGQLYRIGLDGGGAETVARVEGGFLLGLALDGGGAVYACDTGNGCVQRIDPDGRVERYGDSIAYPNYPVFDGDGRLWVSDSGAWEEPTGTLLCIHPGGRTERVAAGPFGFANGLALRDGWLYLVESARPRVVRLSPEGGGPEAVVELERVVPDGLAFDEEGGLWISCWQPNRVYRLAPDGELELVVDDWTGEYVLSPTNVAFAGAGLATLVLASLCGWAVRAIDPGVAGAALHYPEVSR